MKPSLPPDIITEQKALRSQIGSVERQFRSSSSDKHEIVIGGVSERVSNNFNDLTSNRYHPHSSVTVKEIVLEVAEPVSTFTSVNVLVDGDLIQTADLPPGCKAKSTACDFVIPASSSVQITSNEIREADVGHLQVSIVGRSSTSHSSTLLLKTPFEAPETIEDVLIGVVEDIAIDSSGNYLVVGSFSTACQQSVSNVARIHPDGTLDTTFNTNGFPVENLNKVVIQPDGKILVGRTETFAGRSIIAGETTYRGVVRLNTDGTHDQSFQIEVSRVRGWSLQPDGKVVVKVSPSSDNDFNHYALLSSNGELEKYFTPSNNLNENWRFSHPVDENKIVAYGRFSTNNSATFGIYDLDTEDFQNVSVSDGNVDRFGSINHNQQVPVQLSDGSWVTPSSFLQVGSVTNFGGVLKVAADMSSWEVFIPLGINTDARTLDVDQFNNIILGGHRIDIDEQFVGSVVLLTSDGNIETSFDTSLSISSQNSASQGTFRNIKKVISLPDGKILVGGNFTTPSVEGRAPRRNFVRLTEDGSIDTTFPPI